jgi:hypothetical protein
LWWLTFDDKFVVINKKNWGNFHTMVTKKRLVLVLKGNFKGKYPKCHILKEKN